MRQKDPFDRIKYHLYLWLLPLIIVALLSNLIIGQESGGFNQASCIILIVWYAIGWILVYKNIAFRIFEICTLISISILHILKCFSVVYTDMLQNGSVSVGSAALWTPLLFLYMSIVLWQRGGLIYSLFIWGITLVPAVIYGRELSLEARSSLVQFYLSNVAYIILIYFMGRLSRLYAEWRFLENVAYKDFLTGIGNRRMIQIWLDTYMKASQEKGEMFSVILLDIDHFKQINDGFGHDVGDMVLKRFSYLVQEHLDQDALFGRWGGEEFLIICPGMQKEAALDFAHRLKDAVAQFHFDKVGHVTASFGVEELQPGDMLPALLQRADQALYAAKESGRNAVRTMEP